MDSNLLKEAIADAKAVRQTALANAKVALEEAFSERYSAMFAQKLKEDAEEGVAPAAEEEGVKAEENVSEQEIDELIKELEAEVGGEAPEAPDADDVAPMGAPAPAPAAPGAVPPMGAPAPMPGCPPCPPMPAAPGMPGAVPPPMGGEMGAMPPVAPPMGGEMGAMPPAAPAPAPVGGEMGATPPPSDIPPTGEEEADENIDLNELLKSLKEEVEEEEEEEEGKKLDEDKKLASSGIGGKKAGGSDNKKPSASASSTSGIESGGMKQHGVPSPDGTKVGPEDATKAPRPNEGKNATSTNLSTPSKGGQSGPALKAARPNAGAHATDTDLSTPGGMLKENETLKKQLSEAYETLTYVKGQLNEINLLNAKLLYTNKLFKEYNMNNEQKMRIVEMFDLSKNVREVKLTYANIAESLNFGGSDMKRKVATSNTSVQSITEGLASKPVGGTKPSKQVISEGKASEMVSKFQRLAGIKSTK